MQYEDKSNKEKHTINLLGEDLTVTGVSENYVEQLVSYINGIGKEITQAYPRLPRRRLVGLTLINLANKFNKLKKEYNKIKQEKTNLKEENEYLKEQINSLQDEYEELSVLLEEVDG